MTVYLTLDELLAAAERATGHRPKVRDWGLLEAALARPAATVFGQDAYPTLHAKAAALVHSLVTGHPLVDGNKRLGLAGLLLFYGLNGYRLDATQDERVEFVLAIATGQLAEVDKIAERLALWAVPRP